MGEPRDKSCMLTAYWLSGETVLILGSARIGPSPTHLKPLILNSAAETTDRAIVQGGIAPAVSWTFSFVEASAA